MADWQKAARRAAKKYGVDPDIFVRQLRQESGGNPNARSPAGAQGIAQFIPSTARAYGVNLNDGRISDDLDGAARYMRDNLKQFGGDYRKALAAYNAGAGAVQKYGGVPPYAETQNYVKRILGNRVPKASAGGGQARGNTSTRTTTTTTTPGVDNSALRRQLLQQYVLERGRPDALLSLGRGLGQAQDVPGRTTTKVTGGGSQKPVNTGATGAGRRPSDQLTELFYDPLGGVKRGQQIGAIGGHGDHVHVASGPKQLGALKKLATDMGLTITSTTGGKHTPGSYHYQGRAIDVAGPPDLMARYAKAVARKYGIKL